jgi:predicted dehydrogenase
MKKIKWGIIGLGNIARKFADGFKDVSNAELLAIASNNNENLNYFKKNYSIESKFCFNNYDDLINCVDLDIIYISLPNSLHFKYIIDCIKNEKNVLVEKPAVLNISQILKIKETLKNKQVFFTEAFMYRFSPHFLKINEIIKNNLIGKITGMESSFKIRVYKLKKIFGFTFKKPNFNGRLFNKELGGGSILDLGCYPLSLSTYINSLVNPTKIDHFELKKIKKNICPSGVDVSASAEINFNNSFVSKISCSFEEKLNQKTTLFAEDGIININDSWVPNENSNIEIIYKDRKKIIKLKLNKDLYSHEINSISSQLLEQKIEPKFPALNIEEIRLNTQILNKWLQFN